MESVNDVVMEALETVAAAGARLVDLTVPSLQSDLKATSMYLLRSCHDLDAFFAARPELPVATIPGLGTPDIRGQLGVGTYLTTEPTEMQKVKVGPLEPGGKGQHRDGSHRRSDPPAGRPGGGMNAYEVAALPAMGQRRGRQHAPDQQGRQRGGHVPMVTTRTRWRVLACGRTPAGYKHAPGCGRRPG